jgi:hypothetical protein
VLSFTAWSFPLIGAALLATDCVFMFMSVLISVLLCEEDVPIVNWKVTRERCFSGTGMWRNVWVVFESEG